MSTLILGLLIFLGVHSVRIVAGGWRNERLKAWGEKRWKGAYALVALVGFVLIVWGYGQARLSSAELWAPPLWTRHLATLLTLPAFVLVTASQIPGSRIKARLGHPMLIGTLLWALAHLLANGRGADLLLFGAFGVWAALDWASARRRPAGPPPRILAGRDVLVVVVGLLAWAVFAFWAHRWLIGVAPFGGVGS